MNEEAYHKKAYSLLLGLGLAFFITSVVIDFLFLEFDGACTALRGASFGDALSWATSARVKYLHGVWARPNIDEHHYVIVPFHSLFIWLSYKIHGLTLTGLRFPAFVMVTIVKITICWLAYRELGEKWLVVGLIFTACYFPLNEQTRISNPESIQLGFTFMSALTLYLAENKKNHYLFMLSGLLLGVSYFYKSTIFILPIFPFVYFMAKRWLLNDDEKIFSIKSGMLTIYGGFAIFAILYTICWIIPNIEDIYWLYARGHYDNAYGLDMIIQHVQDPLLLLDEYARWYTDANFMWIASLIVIFILMPIMKVHRLNILDVIIFSYILVLAIQLSYTDLAWRRALTLMPFGCLACIRLANIIFKFNENIEKKLSLLSYFVITLGLYIITYYWVNIIFDEPEFSYKVAFVLAMAIGLLLYLSLRVKPAWTALLLAALIAFHLPITLKYSTNYFTQNSSFIKQGSVKLGNAVGEGWVFGAYYYHLYNVTNAFYVSTWTTFLRPDGFSAAREENLTMPEFAKKYKLWTNSIGDIFRALIIDRFFPAYYHRWELPPNYKEIYHSDVFIDPPPSAVTVSDRYLLVAAQYDEVYVAKTFYNDFLKPYANKLPILGPAVVKVKLLPNFPGDKIVDDTIHKVVKWIPVQRQK